MPAGRGCTGHALCSGPDAPALSSPAAQSSRLLEEFHMMWSALPQVQRGSPRGRKEAVHCHLTTGEPGSARLFRRQGKSWREDVTLDCCGLRRTPGFSAA